MKVYRTLSGSIYYVDEENKQICRDGKSGVTTRATTEWRKYTSIAECLGGLLIVWDADTRLLPGSPDGSWPTTLTTKIVDLWEEP